MSVPTRTAMYPVADSSTVTLMISFSPYVMFVAFASIGVSILYTSNTVWLMAYLKYSSSLYTTPTDQLPGFRSPNSFVIYMSP